MKIKVILYRKVLILNMFLVMIFSCTKNDPLPKTSTSTNNSNLNSSTGTSSIGQSSSTSGINQISPSSSTSTISSYLNSSTSTGSISPNSTTTGTIQKYTLIYTNEYTNYLNQKHIYNDTIDIAGIYITKDNKLYFYAHNGMLITIKEFNQALNTNALFQLLDGTSGTGNVEFTSFTSTYASGKIKADLTYSSALSSSKISGTFNNIPISTEPSYFATSKLTYGFSCMTALFTEIPTLNNYKFTFNSPFYPCSYDSSNHISFSGSQNGYYLGLSLPKNISTGFHTYTETGINVTFNGPIQVHYTQSFYTRAGSITIISNDLPSRTLEGEMDFDFQNSLQPYGYSVSGGYFKVRY